MEEKEFIIELNTSSDPESEFENNSLEEAAAAAALDHSPDSERKKDVPDGLNKEDGARVPSETGGGELGLQQASSGRTAQNNQEAKKTSSSSGSKPNSRHSSPQPEKVTKRQKDLPPERHQQAPNLARPSTAFSKQCERYDRQRSYRAPSQTDRHSSAIPGPTDSFIQKGCLHHDLPYLYICPAGFLTVLLPDNVAVEMTLDNTVRLVNNSLKASAAVSSDGRLASIHHELAKIYQTQNQVEADVFLERRAKLSPDRALFASKLSCFQLARNGIQKADPDFGDLSHDMSVSVLYSSSSYGPHLVDSYLARVQSAKYYYTKNSSLLVWIDGIKILQDKAGDVTVQSGSNVIRASAPSGCISVETPFLKSTVDETDKVKVSNQQYELEASFSAFTISDGRRECGFDGRQEVFIRPRLDAKRLPPKRLLSAAGSRCLGSAYDDRPSPNSEGKDIAASRTTTGHRHRGHLAENAGNTALFASPYLYYRYLNYHKLTCASFVYS